MNSEERKNCDQYCGAFRWWDDTNAWRETHKKKERATLRLHIFYPCVVAPQHPPVIIIIIAISYTIGNVHVFFLLLFFSLFTNQKKSSNECEEWMSILYEAGCGQHSFWISLVCEKKISTGGFHSYHHIRASFNRS